MRQNLKTLVKGQLLKPALFFNSNFAYTNRLTMAFARGAVNLSMRKVDPLRPHTWEFSAFSQNGEDGMIQQLLSYVREPNRYFVEIGASDGLENNTSFLAFGQKYSGIMIDADSFKLRNAQRFLQPLNWAVKYRSLFVEPATVTELLGECNHMDPDFFSLDIDSNDYFVLRALLESSFHPKVICVEYNSAFGPSSCLSIRYTARLDYQAFHSSELYYGASLGAWRSLLGRYGYSFVAVETRGINAFFVDTDVVDLPEDLEGLAFAENAGQLQRHGVGWPGQFAKIANLPFDEV